MFKKLFCRHKLVYIAHNASYSSNFSLWQCKKCGKYFVYDKNNDKYYRITFPNWSEWYKVGADNGEG